MQNLLHHVYDLLKQDERLISTEGDLLKNKIQELAYKLDEQLIGLLLGDNITKEKFFVAIKDVIVFDQKKFVQFINNKEFLPDSYTAFKNKIGLTDGRGNFINESSDVVLERPYKDGVLAGGQNKEDTKRDEIFYNEVLGSDQIDRLLDSKTFTNFKKYTEDGEESVQDFTRDENGVIKDNLIIKGNNLLALHSLKKQFAGKVKLIYIDPPYNTGNDGFKYNDKFNHSTWLTFMKNRLEVAKELLRDDGVIFVQCDDNEQAYLKVLIDEILGRDQSDCFIWRKSGVGRDGKMKNTTTFRKDHEYIIVGYKNQKTLKKSFETPNWENIYPNLDDDPRGGYKAGSISKKEEASNKNHKNYYTVISPSGKSFSRQFDVSKSEFTRLDSDNRIYWGSKGDSVPAVKIFQGEKRETNTSSLILFSGTSTEAKKEMEELFMNIDEFSTPKPESLMEKIISISTENGDIVLDYHLGSGTTCAVAHKMGRQYIGIEQMDYVKTIAVERMKKVIEGEQGGISKSVDRQGGGEFIYMEITQNNERLIQTIQNTQTSQDLISLYHQLKDSSFINYNIDIKTIDDYISDFEQLSLENMKRILIEMIDKNAVYVNYSEMNDESYAISEEDKALNNKFYQ